MEAKLDGRQAGRARPADVQHRLARRPLARRPGRAARPRSCSPSRRTCCAPGRSTATTCGAGSTGRPTSSELHPDGRARLRRLPRPRSTDDYAPYTFEFAAAEARVPVEQIPSSPRSSPGAATALSAHVWRSAAAGNLGGWQVARCLFFLNVLTGSVGTPGGTSPTAGTSSSPHGFDVPEGHDVWNELLWPPEYPLSHQRDVDPAAALPGATAAETSTSTSPASTTRSGPTPTGSAGSRR